MFQREKHPYPDEQGEKNKKRREEVQGGWVPLVHHAYCLVTPLYSRLSGGKRHSPRSQVIVPQPERYPRKIKERQKSEPSDEIEEGEGRTILEEGEKWFGIQLSFATHLIPLHLLAPRPKYDPSHLLLFPNQPTNLNDNADEAVPMR